MSKAASRGRKARTPRRRRPLTGKRIVLIVLILFAVSFLAIRGAIAWRYNAELVALREAGLPTNLQELRDWQELPERGAQDTYQQAFDALVEDPLEESQRADLIVADRAPVPEPNEPLTEAQIAAAEAYLSPQERALALLSEAAAEGGGRIPGPADAMPLDLPLEESRNAMKAVGLAAIVAAERGHEEAAVRALEVASYLPPMLDGQNQILPMLARGTLEGQWIWAAQRVMGRLSLDGPALGLLDAARRRVAGADSAFEQALFGEQARLLSQQIVDEVPELSWLQFLHNASGLGPLDRMQSMGTVQRIQEALQIDSPQQRIARIRDLADEEPPAWALQTHIFLPSFDRPLIADYRTRAYGRAMLIAVAAYRYFIEQEQRPESLDDLVPRYLSRLPEDPFTGDPMIFRTEGDTILIYSVGENGEDDGGDNSDEAIKDDRHDIGVFELHLPESPGG